MNQPRNIDSEMADGPSNIWPARVVSWGRELILILIIVLGISWWQTRNLVESGRQLPMISLPGLDGTVYTLNDKSNPVVLYFFAPWCGVCGAVAHNVVALADDKDIEVVGIALSYDDPDEIEDFLLEHNLEKMMTLLGNQGTARAFNIQSFPTFYIAENGIISGRSVGYTTELGLRIRAL